MGGELKSFFSRLIVALIALILHLPMFYAFMFVQRTSLFCCFVALIARISALTVQLYLLRTRWLFMKVNVFKSSLNTYGLSKYIAIIPLVLVLTFYMKTKVCP